MPLSKKRDRARKRKEAKQKRPQRMSKRDVRVLRSAGIDPEVLAGEPPSENVSGRVVNVLVRELEAKRSRVEWQSGGIKMLHDEIATLQARLEIIQSTDLALMLQSRVTTLEAEIALMQADLQADAIQPLDDEEVEALSSVHGEPVGPHGSG